ncbi:MAG: ornithine carbamoyltransferase, partial [Candidatus Lokiarchaeota archaeon]|nr:ornithine carbamoyltransferase [Candidatus Lokiarchaeota archaeon]
MKNLLTLKDLTEAEVLDLIEFANTIKKNPEKYTRKLFGKIIILLFQKTSTRTRISFESGMHQLGGNAIYIDWRTTNIRLGSLADEIKCMALYSDAIMAR